FPSLLSNGILPVRLKNCKYLSSVHFRTFLAIDEPYFWNSASPVFMMDDSLGSCGKAGGNVSRPNSGVARIDAKHRTDRSTYTKRLI
ncbi:MAG TPA: hypothetical protein P5307_18570, partial [Pirellulaceae bacterium]|nr:hypothetical protein [Pirellulaceae bacterium]